MRRVIFGKKYNSIVIGDVKFEDKGFITPIQLEIKQYLNDDNRLYLVIALKKIELNKDRRHG